jgi:hypothetical protein
LPDKASQALVLNFIETLLKKLWKKKQSPEDPFGNKAWKKKLREEVSVWSEEDVREWEENLRKLSNWEPQTG